MSRTLPEPKITAPAARALYVAGLKAFARDTFGKSLPPPEAQALAAARTDAANLARRIEAGEHRGTGLLEIRGLDLDKKGTPGENDRNVNDDGLILIPILGTQTGPLVSIRGNVDPTYTRAGMAAKVAPQHYRVQLGRHRDRMGLRQSSPVLIDRDGPGGVEYRTSPAAWPYTNVHDDRGAGTGSAGCSTAPIPDFAILFNAAKGAGVIDVVLVDEKARRAGAYGPGL